MREIHVVHRRIGGVGHIISLLESRGFSVLTLKFASFLDFFKSLKCVEYECIYFHQPMSHLYCLFLALTRFNHRKKFCCVLHEASNYNLGVTPLYRAALGAFLRFFVVRACILLGVEVRGVSRFVCSSYLIPPIIIDYTYLFTPALESAQAVETKKALCAVIWLRRGTGKNSFNFLIQLYAIQQVREIVVLGDEIECGAFLNALRNHPSLCKLILVNQEFRVSESVFLLYLAQSRWFVSFYHREGFGLSAFQAVFFGCVVACEWAGALKEWVPIANLNLAKMVESGIYVSFNEVDTVSKINIEFARGYNKS